MKIRHMKKIPISLFAGITDADKGVQKAIHIVSSGKCVLQAFPVTFQPSVLTVSA